MPLQVNFLSEGHGTRVTLPNLALRLVTFFMSLPRRAEMESEMRREQEMKQLTKPVLESESNFRMPYSIVP